jgi:hypothetical protein
MTGREVAMAVILRSSRSDIVFEKRNYFNKRIEIFI